MLLRIAGEEISLAVGEQVGQRQVDRPHRAMEIDRAEQLCPHADEADQGRKAAAVDRQPALAEKAVVQEPLQIEGPRAVAGHVGVAEDEVHVVDRVEAAEQAAQELQPWRLAVSGGCRRAGNQIGNLRRIELFARRQSAEGIASHAADAVPQLLLDDRAAQHFVVQAVRGEVVLVEEVSERSMPHVVQEGRQSQQRLDVAAAGNFGANFREALVQVGRRAAGQVHDSQHVLKPRVLGCGEYEPCRLKLMNLSQPLQPGTVDQLLFGHFARRQSAGRHKRDVAMDRVVAEAFVLVAAHQRLIYSIGICSFRMAAVRN